MSLNEKLEFASAPQDVKKAFLGVPDKIYVRPGTKLYKFTDYPLVAENGQVTPWWSFVLGRKLPSGGTMEGLRRSEEHAARLGVSHRRYQQVRSAVSEQFNNNLTHLLLIFLKQEVWGFAGRTSGQPEFKNPAMNNVYLIGGKGQLWIPGLTSAHVEQINAVG
jgi:hypothetical protein